jgi:hypothetical protein
MKNPEEFEKTRNLLGSLGDNRSLKEFDNLMENIEKPDEKSTIDEKEKENKKKFEEKKGKRKNWKSGDEIEQIDKKEKRKKRETKRHKKEKRLVEDFKKRHGHK